MSRLLTLVVLLMSASPASALRQPKTPEQLKELAAIGTKLAGEKTAYETSLTLLRDAYKLIDGKMDKEADIAALEQKLATLNAAHAVVMTDIVKRTVTLFDIQPGPTSGHIVGGEFLNSTPSWAPVFAPQVPQKTIQVPNKPSITLTAHGPYAGITWADGTVELNEKAFLSPGYLAAVILHESVHYAQMTTVGRGDSITGVRAEIEAHSKSSGPEAAAAFGLTDIEKGKLKAAFTENIKRFQNRPNMNMMSLQFAGADPEPIKERSELDFLTPWQQGSSAVSEMAAAARAKLEEERKARAAREAHIADVRAKEAERKDRMERERLDRLNTPWGALLEWAGNACSYMDYDPETVPINYQDVSAPNLQYIAWAEKENEGRLSQKRRSDAAAKEYMLAHSVVMPQSEIASALAAEGKKLSRCSRSVVEMVQDAPDPIDSRWLVAQLDYKRNGGVFGAVFRGIASGITHAAGALIHGIQAPFVSNGSSSSGGVREPSERPARETPPPPREPTAPPVERERPTPSHNPYRQNYRQLRGVASGASFD